MQKSFLPSFVPYSGCSWHCLCSLPTGSVLRFRSFLFDCLPKIVHSINRAWQARIKSTRTSIPRVRNIRKFSTMLFPPFSRQNCSSDFALLFLLLELQLPKQGFLVVGVQVNPATGVIMIKLVYSCMKKTFLKQNSEINIQNLNTTKNDEEERGVCWLSRSGKSRDWFLMDFFLPALLLVQ